MIVREIFGDRRWRYTPPASREKAGHLEGYQQDPPRRFEWPKELVEWYREYEKRQRQQRGKKTKKK